MENNEVNVIINYIFNYKQLSKNIDNIETQLKMLHKSHSTTVDKLVELRKEETDFMKSLKTKYGDEVVTKTLQKIMTLHNVK